MFSVVLQRYMLKRSNPACILLILAIMMHLSNTSIARPRCWIGVIDQINPPWVFITGEYDEEAVLSLQQVYASAAEGDWVVYWVNDQRLDLFKSPQTQAEKHRLRVLTDALLNTPKNRFNYEEWMSDDLKKNHRSGPQRDDQVR